MLKCGACGEKYEGSDGSEDKKAVLFPCLCKLCKGCARKWEAKALENGKEKKDTRLGGATPQTPCLNCDKVCNVPVADLLLDVALMVQLSPDPTATVEVPLCAMCEEELATKHCHACQMFMRNACDGCHAIMHKSAKKQGHAFVSIQEHQASAPAPASAAEVAKTTPLLCPEHVGKQLDSYCDTCEKLSCALCLFKHSGHKFKALADVSGEHKQQIEAAIKATTASKDAVHASIEMLNQLDKTVGENEQKTLKAVDCTFKPLEQAVAARKRAVKAVVTTGAERKKAAISAQVWALEHNETNACSAVALSVATIEIGSLARLLQYKQTLLNGLHGLQLDPSALAPPCGPGFEIIGGPIFQNVMTLIPKAVDAFSDDSDPALSKV